MSESDLNVDMAFARLACR